MRKAVIVPFLSLLLLVGCTVEQVLPTAAPTAPAPTITPIPPSPTADISVSTATVTPTWVPTESPTPIPTATQRPTSTPSAFDPSLPLPTGNIYFLWDPSEAKGGLEDNPKYNLYKAMPGVTPTDWHIVPILEDLHGQPLIDISPDQTKIAFTVLEDRNGDGSISAEGAARGFDGSNLYVYTFVDGTFERITDDFPSIFALGWLPDDQTVTYSDGANIFLFDLADTSDIQLTDTFPEGIAELTWAPDGQLLAIELYSGELYFFDKTTNTITQISGVPGVFESDILVWSSDSKWLASTTQLTAGLFLINRHTKEIVELVGHDFFSVPVWSSDGQWLAFTQSTRETASSLFVWNAKTRMTQFVIEANDVSPAVWLPNSDSFVTGFVNDDEGGLLLINVAVGTTHKILQEDFITKIEPLSWSPDGEWLLFLLTRNDEAGMHLIHRDGGEVYPVLVTTNTNDPYALIWLP